MYRARVEARAPILRPVLRCFALHEQALTVRSSQFDRKQQLQWSLPLEDGKLATLYLHSLLSYGNGSWGVL
jgi:hypothetical protein